MLTTVQRNLAALKLELLREARDVPHGYVDQINIAIAHINDAAGIIQGVCLQVEPNDAKFDADRVAERQELAELREQVQELRDEQRKQPDQPAPAPKPDREPPPDYDVEAEIQGIDPNATAESTAAAVADLYPIADPDSAELPMGDPKMVAAEQARASGRLADEQAREGDPAEPGWG